MKSHHHSKKDKKERKAEHKGEKERSDLSCCSVKDSCGCYSDPCGNLYVSSCCCG